MRLLKQCRQENLECYEFQGYMIKRFVGDCKNSIGKKVWYRPLDELYRNGDYKEYWQAKDGDRYEESP